MDTYDDCVMGRTGFRTLARASGLLSLKNPNVRSREILTVRKRLEGTERRWVAFNGGVGSTQLDWIESELIASRSSSERVVMLAHQPFHPDSCNPICLPHNYEALLNLTDSFSSTVVGYLQRAHSLQRLRSRFCRCSPCSVRRSTRERTWRRYVQRSLGCMMNGL